MSERKTRQQRSNKTRKADRLEYSTGPSATAAAKEDDKAAIQRTDQVRDSADADAVQPTLIVAVGASAGGLEALERFFDHMPADSGMAFVVIQHLSPDFKSLMDELLARHTKMAIHRAEDGMSVEPNAIYLMPPKHELRIKDGKLVLSDREDTQGLNLPIDLFFEALAQDCGARAVAVILSGSGSDGSRGAAAVHRAGGLVIVQKPESAKFSSMPSSTIDTGFANFVMPPEQMSETLLRHAEHPSPPDTQPETSLPKIAQEGEFAELFAMLLDKYGIDFTNYKPTTVMRRIQRRMELSGAASESEFIARVANDSGELNRLYQDLLIGVTQFFRDEEAFDHLQRDVLRPLLERKGPQEEFRIWDAGCATGEETYSLAMLLHELREEMEDPPGVKIFATDVHCDSLDHASSGLYTAESLANIRSDRWRKYFRPEADAHRISPELRKMIVFAPHNVAKDAPFTKMDVVVCRNLLIYLQPNVQQRVMHAFHFALNVKGVLMLGPSESIAELKEEFETISSHWKLYRKKRNTRLPEQIRVPLTEPTPRHRAPKHARLLPSAAPAPSPRLLRAYDSLLEQVVPPGVLVNERFDVVHVFGDARKILHPPVGRSTADVLMMVDGDLRVALAAALQRASKEERAVTYDAVPLRHRDDNDFPCHERSRNKSADGGAESPDAGRGSVLARLTVMPIPDRQDGYPHFLISFETHGFAPPAREPEEEFRAAEISGSRIASLEAELTYTRESLQATVEELQTSNEELQATNEELVASNEELQSTNEELHSVNEELHTVNSEYQRKID